MRTKHTELFLSIDMRNRIHDWQGTAIAPAEPTTNANLEIGRCFQPEHGDEIDPLPFWCR